jgi:hypothetical protein
METISPVVEARMPVTELSVTEEPAEPVEAPEPVETISPVVEARMPAAEPSVTEEPEKPVEMPKPAPEPTDAKSEIVEEMEIEGFKIAVAIPYHVFQQAHSATHEYRLKVAGALAAQILKKYPELTSTPSADPISIWSDIREFVASQLR